MKCYNLFKNNCDLSCQGCSYCPGAKKSWSEVSRRTMIKYMIKCKYENWKWNKFYKKYGDEIWNEIKESLKKR